MKAASLILLLFSLSVLSAHAQGTCGICAQVSALEKEAKRIDKLTDPVEMSEAENVFIDKAADLVNGVLRGDQIDQENATALMKFSLILIPHDMEMIIPEANTALFRKHYEASNSTLKAVLAKMLSSKQLSKSQHLKLLEYYGAIPSADRLDAEDDKEAAPKKTQKKRK